MGRDSPASKVDQTIQKKVQPPCARARNAAYTCISLFPRHRFSATTAAASTRKVYSNKRVPVSPASVAEIKSLFSFDATEKLQCLICQELVVDAVQVTCCGALHCRACISKCDKCPPVPQACDCRLDCIVPDVRWHANAWAVAAACSRPCLNAQQCTDATSTEIALHSPRMKTFANFPPAAF
jgi:hypothetical protein